MKYAGIDYSKPKDYTHLLGKRKRIHATASDRMTRSMDKRSNRNVDAKCDVLSIITTHIKNPKDILNIISLTKNGSTIHGVIIPGRSSYLPFCRQIKHPLAFPTYDTRHFSSKKYANDFRLVFPNAPFELVTSSNTILDCLKLQLLTNKNNLKYSLLVWQKNVDIKRIEHPANGDTLIYLPNDQHSIKIDPRNKTIQSCWQFIKYKPSINESLIYTGYPIQFVNQELKNITSLTLAKSNRNYEYNNVLDMDQEKITCLTYKDDFSNTKGKVTIHARGNEKTPVKVKHDNKTISCLLYAITVKENDQPQRTVICSGKPNKPVSVSEDEVSCYTFDMLEGNKVLVRDSGDLTIPMHTINRILTPSIN